MGFTGAVLERCSFRPGASMEWRPDDTELVISDLYPDSCRPGAEVGPWKMHSDGAGVPFPHDDIVSATTETEAVLVVCHWAMDLFVASEIHEIQEWFRFDGRRVHSPHVMRAPATVEWPWSLTEAWIEDFFYSDWGMKE